MEHGGEKEERDKENEYVKVNSSEGYHVLTKGREVLQIYRLVLSQLWLRVWRSSARRIFQQEKSFEI